MIELKLTPKQADTLAYWLEYAESATSTDLDYVSGQEKVDLRNEHKRVISIKKKLFKKASWLYKVC